MLTRRSIFTVASRVGAGISSPGWPKANSILEKGPTELKEDAKETLQNVAEGAEKTAKAAARNPLLSVGFGVATALAGYTVFCYAGSNDESEAAIAENSRRRQDAHLANMQKRAREKTAAYEGRYSIVGHQDPIPGNVDPDQLHGLNRSEADLRRIYAAGYVGTGELPAWKQGHMYNTSVNKTGLFGPSSFGEHDVIDDLRDEPMAWHTKDHADKIYRTDRLDAESRQAPGFLADRKDAVMQGFRRVSREAGNEERTTATNPDEIKRDIRLLIDPEEPYPRFYANKSDITRADKLSFDGGARASRDGEAMSDYAKKISTLP